MWLLSLLFLAGVQPAESRHLENNPVFEELRNTGVQVETEKFKLPEPYLADGLDVATQRQLIEKLGGRRYRWELLTRDSAVAPQILHLEEETPQDTDTKARMVRVYFVVYGDLKDMEKQGGLAEPENTPGKQWKTLTAEDLAAKEIKLDDPDRETYGYFTNDLIDKVRVSGVLRTYRSRTEDSIVAAAILDPRFHEDADYPNRWQPLTGRPGGMMTAGTPHPYQGGGGYTKITKLKDPAGALFVESHLIFSEPHAWFNGANLFASKLPAVIQHEVRSTRRQILQAKEN